MLPCKGIASMTVFINSRLFKDHKYVLNFHTNLKKFSIQILYTKLTNAGLNAKVQLECVPQGPVLADLVYLMEILPRPFVPATPGYGFGNNGVELVVGHKLVQHNSHQV